MTIYKIQMLQKMQNNFNWWQHKLLKDEICNINEYALKNVSTLGQPYKIVHFLSPTSIFILFKLNITFYSKCYLHHNCSINLNWNNTQLYSSAKPLCNVPSSVFWLINFCFLPFLHRTSIQKWKKNCYVHNR